MPRRMQAAVVLATIPYLLLSGSQWAKVRTHVYVSGAGLRSVEVAADPGRRKEISRWLDEGRLGHTTEVRTVSQSSVVLSRSSVVADLPAVTDGVNLHIRGVTSHPFSLYTDYFWSEEIRIQTGSATDIELEGKPQAKIEYEVTLPGRVVQDSVIPAAAVRHGTVTWNVQADSPQQTLQARSRIFRWDYLLLVLYILAYVAYRMALYIDRILGYRPRRI